MINIVIPLAGRGSRFSKAGYEKPKPFIDVMGVPMIERVLENLVHPESNVILIARREHVTVESALFESLQIRFGIHLVEIEAITEGTACTVLAASQLIDSAVPLLIANSDQLVNCRMDAFVGDCLKRQLDGSILVFEDQVGDPKWSFAQTDSEGTVLQVKEKEVISRFATVGIYFYSQGRDFVRAAKAMIDANERVNGEFYVAPAYNYMIQAGKKIGIFEISADAMFGLGTPDDLTRYVELTSAGSPV